MANISVRGLDDETVRLLKESSRKTGKSVNSQVIEFVRRGLGLVTREPGKGVHMDLDHLGGTWSEVESREFEQRIAPFEVVEEELWR